MGLKMDLYQLGVSQHLQHEADSDLVLIVEALTCNRAAFFGRVGNIDRWPGLFVILKGFSL